MVRDLLRARASAEIGAHERAEDFVVAVACCPQAKCRSIVSDKRASKRSMIENMPPKGTILSDFIRTFAILDSVSVGNLFFATLK
jgi:hypothetical protein